MPSYGLTGASNQRTRSKASAASRKASSHRIGDFGRQLVQASNAKPEQKNKPASLAGLQPQVLSSSSISTPPPSAPSMQAAPKRSWREWATGWLPEGVRNALPHAIVGRKYYDVGNTRFTPAQMKYAQTVVRPEVERGQKASRDFVWNNVNTALRQTSAHVATQTLEMLAMPEDAAAWATRKVHRLARPHEAPLQQTIVSRRYLVKPAWEGISGKSYAAYEHMSGEDLQTSHGVTYALLVPTLFAGGLKLASSAPSLLKLAKTAIAERGAVKALGNAAGRVAAVTGRFARGKATEAAEDLALTFRTGVGGMKSAGRGAARKLAGLADDVTLKGPRLTPALIEGDATILNRTAAITQKEGRLAKLLQPKSLNIFKNPVSRIGRLYAHGNMIINRALFKLPVNSKMKIPFTLRLRALGSKLTEKLFGVDDFMWQIRVNSDLTPIFLKSRSPAQVEFFKATRQVIESLKQTEHACRNHIFPGDVAQDFTIFNQIKNHIKALAEINKGLNLQGLGDMGADISQLRGACINLYNALLKDDFAEANNLLKTIADLFEEQRRSSYLSTIEDCWK